MTSTFPYHFTGDRRSVNFSQCAYTRSSNKLPLKSSLLIFEGMIYTIYNQLVALIPYEIYPQVCGLTVRVGSTANYEPNPYVPLASTSLILRLLDNRRQNNNRHF